MWVSFHLLLTTKPTLFSFPFIFYIIYLSRFFCCNPQFQITHKPTTPSLHPSAALILSFPPRIWSSMRTHLILLLAHLFPFPIWSAGSKNFPALLFRRFLETFSLRSSLSSSHWVCLFFSIVFFVLSLFQNSELFKGE